MSLNPALVTKKFHRFHKLRRPFGNPVATPKEFAHFEPPPFSNLQNLNLPLHVVLPEVENNIIQAGRIVFHTTGDIGGINGTQTQEAIVGQMEEQVSKAPDGDRPVFFYHLGDVVYYNGQSAFYRQEFYEPYQFYPAPIFAIAGNHDGDTGTRPGDPPVSEPTLTGFMNNFCDTQPRYNFPHRPTMTQPYVYWTLEAPFVTIIGLYSNVEGMLDGRGTNEQQRWFEDQLQAAPTDKCLIVTVHHPLYSLDDFHGGTPDIVDALERAMNNTGRVPDAVFSGHVHNYQRFTRKKEGREIPYLVAGAAGYANSPRSLHRLQRHEDGSLIETPFPTNLPEVTLESFNQTESGFVRITIDNRELRGEYFTVPFNSDAHANLFDSFTLDLKTHHIK